MLLMIVAIVYWVWMEDKKLKEQTALLRGASGGPSPSRRRRGDHASREADRVSTGAVATSRWLTPVLLLGASLACAVGGHHPRPRPATAAPWIGPW